MHSRGFTWSDTAIKKMGPCSFFFYSLSLCQNTLDPFLGSSFFFFPQWQNYDPLLGWGLEFIGHWKNSCMRVMCRYPCDHTKPIHYSIFFSIISFKTGVLICLRYWLLWALLKQPKDMKKIKWEVIWWSSLYIHFISCLYIVPPQTSPNFRVWLA